MNPLKLFSAFAEIKKAYNAYKVLAPLAEQLVTNQKTLDKLHDITATLDKAIVASDTLKTIIEQTSTPKDTK